ncbi:MAG: phosphatidate cytidylyltransferase [Flavobacteriales bacterium]|nr:phosphatidate cytidylyltransferase [Flavobacteriales bacterium]
MSNMLIRAITGVVFLAVMIGSMLLGGYLFLGVFSLVVFFSLKEYFKLVRNFSQPLELPAIALYLVGSISVQFLSEALFFPFLLAISIPLMVIELFRKNEQQVMHAITVTFPLVWIVLPMALLIHLGFHPVENIEPWKILLPYFILLWVNDTFAYLSGKFLGKHQLAPHISVGKTIEGTLGGIIFTLIAAYLIFQWIEVFALWKWLVAAAIIAPLGVASDLFESIFKRKAGVKDSGNLLPGHGGLLDRFDSVFFTAPIYYLIINW